MTCTSVKLVQVQDSVPPPPQNCNVAEFEWLIDSFINNQRVYVIPNIKFRYGYNLRLRYH
jgi:hypothetical protein